MDNLDFCAIDFETANSRDTSACSIGIAVVENGSVKETHHYYIKPFPEYFSAKNISIHGIRPTDVVDAPTFDQLWPIIRQYIDGRVIAAHYAPFDVGVLLGALDYYGVKRPESDILCSCRMARVAFPMLPSHKLNIVCGYLNIPLDHHRADSDAEGCAGIIIEIARKYGINTLTDIRRKLRLEPGSIRNGQYTPIKKWF